MTVSAAMLTMIGRTSVIALPGADVEALQRQAAAPRNRSTTAAARPAISHHRRRPSGDIEPVTMRCSATFEAYHKNPRPSAGSQLDCQTTQPRIIISDQRRFYVAKCLDRGTRSDPWDFARSCFPETQRKRAHKDASRPRGNGTCV